MAISPVPDDRPRVSAYLSVDDAAAAIDFYTAVLGATERGGRFVMPDGRVGHAELGIGDSLVMLADEFPEMDFVGPKAIGGSPVRMHLYVEDVDATFAAAVEAGATAEREPEDQFYGQRSGQFTDPWGHRWTVASVIEEITEEEMMRRVEQMG